MKAVLLPTVQRWGQENVHPWVDQEAIRYHKENLKGAIRDIIASTVNQNETGSEPNGRLAGMSGHDIAIV